MVNLFDSNNYARVEFEVDPTGLPLRRLFHKAFYDLNPCLFIFDGFGAKKLRQEKYPDYKAGRKKAPDNFYVMLGFYKELLLHTNHTVIEVPGYEADDVIATLVRANPNIPVTIHSTDRDFCALEEPDRVLVPNAKLKGVERQDVRLYKTLVGDPGDNIKGIKLFGEKAWGLLTFVQKARWIGAFESRTVGTAVWGEDLGLTREMHKHWVAENSALLQTYWDIVGFYDVPMDLINQHSKAGVPDFPLADKKLRDMLQ